MAFLYNLKQLLIAIDQLIQVVIGLLVSCFLWEHKVNADETMSAYLYRHSSLWYCKPLEFIVNCLMYIPERLIYKYPWGHCKRAYDNENYKGEIKG